VPFNPLILCDFAVLSDYHIMKFRHCVFIAIVFHLSIMVIPMEATIGRKYGNVKLVITDGEIALSSNPEQKKHAKITPPVIRKDTTLRKKKKSVRKSIKRKHVEKRTTPSLIKPPLDVQPDAADTLSVDVPVLNHETDNPVVPQNPAPAPLAGAGGEPVVVKFGSAEGPRFQRRVLPRYPVMAKRLNKEGEVILMLIIDEDGKLTNAEVIKKAGFGFDEEALKAVRKSLFFPSVINGRSMICKVILPVRFELR